MSRSPGKDKTMITTIITCAVCTVWALVGMYFMYMIIRDDIKDQREKRERKAIETEREIRQTIRDEEWREKLRKESLEK
jgi:uncharacterized membrane protein